MALAVSLSAPPAAAGKFHWAMSLFRDAQPRIFATLKEKFRSLTKNDIEKIIRSELTRAAQNTSKQEGSDIKFEILSGKLKIDASKTIAGVTVTGGELNLYKASALISAPIAACKEVVGDELKECLKNALSKGKDMVANAFMAEANAETSVTHEPWTTETPITDWPIDTRAKRRLPTSVISR